MITGIGVLIAASSATALIAYRCSFLTFLAAIAASILGSIILIFGGWDWGVTTAGSFFVTALLSQRQDRLEAHESSFTKVPRDHKQVLANGLLLTVLAIVYRASGGNQAIVAAFLGSVGAVAGDTWATAAAQFSAGNPRLLASRQRVPAGTPGAITNVGIALSALAGLVGGMLYLSADAIFGGESTPGTVRAILCVAAITGALAGSLFDSFLGGACQALYTDGDGQLTDRRVARNGTPNKYIHGWRWLSNDLVNFSNAVAGGLTAFFIWTAGAWLHIV